MNRTKVKVYYPISQEFEANAVAVEIEQATGTSVAQVSAITPETHLGQDPGYLIRVWPINGTAEYGGGNTTFLSVTVQFDADGQPYLENLSTGRRGL